MERLKRYWFLLVSCIVFVLLGLGLFLFYQEGNLLPHQLKIGATYMTMNNDFYKTLNEEIEQEVSENSDILLTRDPGLDAAKQAQQIDYFIQEKVAVIIINPVDRNSSAIIKKLKKAKRQGIKIVVVDSQIQGADFVDSTILSDNYQAGVLCAEQLMRDKTSAKILLLEHESAVSGADRIRGFLETIAGHPSYQVVARRDVLGQTELALPAVQEVIASGVSFDTVMALNDQAAMGALAALDQAGLDTVGVYGIDGSPNMKALIETTAAAKATVAQSPYDMGKAALEASYQLASGKSYPSQKVIEVALIDKDNISQYDTAGWQ
ncbi:substrate-binding domain-containing protein [Streptococcus loxodontisalivarius]|uniref:Ribose transport system substrate-binding protein n=1 Tax=Streptococcus loxodontisalivarius TaxID=1349415 RepID=A0ABS2PUZ0_9STRE|nr:substrate-binding domain-containing protein [Streptococcus loxodontisalivarius]MBM7643763.1 ribose transport system substrate-binding protein [Streptococcus loxodontisalivarius]